MKPLELIAYVRTTCADGCCTKWADPRDWSLIERDWGTEHKPNTDRSDYDSSKRLTDAELAAEYWKQVPVPDRVMECMGVSDPAHDEALEKVATLHRFATLPHYDEVTE